MKSKNKLILVVFIASVLSIIFTTINLAKSNYTSDILLNYDPSKKTIKIKITDFWHDEPKDKNSECFICDLLKDRYNVMLTNKPDFLFYSVFGKKHRKYKDCVKTFIIGENLVPDFNLCDYAISYNHINFGDRHFRYGGFSDDIYKFVKAKKNVTLSRDLAKRKFCNFIYSDHNQKLDGVVLREKFFKLLSKYKHVDSPGVVFNNMKNAIEPRKKDWHTGKIEFIKGYKFTIAFENSNSDGYTTEKLPDVLCAHSIPIYYGNPKVGLEYNKKAFIHANDYNSLEEVVQKVIELDNDDDAYMAMLNEPPLLNPSYDPQAELKKFLINIIEKGNKPFVKNPLKIKIS